METYIQEFYKGDIFFKTFDTLTHTALSNKAFKNVSAKGTTTQKKGGRKTPSFDFYDVDEVC